MTYFLKDARGNVRRHVGRPPAMDGLFDVIMDVAAPGLVAAGKSAAEAIANHETNECVARASADPKIKQIDDYIYSIAKEWQPTGFYTPDEIRTIVTQVQIYLTDAMSTVMASPNPYTVGDRDTVVEMAASRCRVLLGLQQSSEANAQTFLTAVQHAQSGSIEAINAPGLKRWVISSLQAMSGAMTTRSVLECSMGAMDRLAGFVSAVWSVLKTIGRLVVSAATAVLKIPDAIGQMWTVVKWGTIIGGSAFLAWKLREAYRARR